MNLPLGSYHSAKGLDEIQQRNPIEMLYRIRRAERDQRRAINDGVWRPIVAFLIAAVFFGMMVSSICDKLGIR